MASSIEDQELECILAIRRKAQKCCLRLNRFSIDNDKYTSDGVERRTTEKAKQDYKDLKVLVPGNKQTTN